MNQLSEALASAGFPFSFGENFALLIQMGGSIGCLHPPRPPVQLGDISTDSARLLVAKENNSVESIRSTFDAGWHPSRKFAAANDLGVRSILGAAK